MNLGVRASGTDYGLGLEMELVALKPSKDGKRKPSMAAGRAPVPVELEKVGMRTVASLPRESPCGARAAGRRRVRPNARLSPSR